MASVFHRLSRPVKLRRQDRLIGQRDAVLRSHYLVRQPLKRILGEGLVLLGAEDQSDGRVLALSDPVLPRIVQVEVHLPGVGVGEAAYLQVDDHQTSQAPVKEQQVHPVPLTADAQPPLPADEAQVVTQLQEEGLQMADECLLQVALGVLVLEVEEFENEGVFDLFVGKRNVFRTLPLSARQHGGPVLREGGALVELGADLPVELADRPPSSQRLGLIEFAGALVSDRQQPHIGGLGERKGCERVVEAHFDSGGFGFARQRLANLLGRI